MPATASPRHVREREERPEPRQPRLRVVASRRRRQPSPHTRLVRGFILVVLCLTVLAVGRVALSFAVVEKTVATDELVAQRQQLEANNAQLTEELAHLGSSVRINGLARKDLGLVEAAHVRYLRAFETRPAVGEP